VELRDGLDAPYFRLRQPEGKIDLNIRFVDGPEYPLRDRAKEYWDLFDAVSESDAPPQGDRPEGEE
jgi:hypothetical protein